VRNSTCGDVRMWNNLIKIMWPVKQTFGDKSPWFVVKLLIIIHFPFITKATINFRSSCEDDFSLRDQKMSNKATILSWFEKPEDQNFKLQAKE